MDARGLACPFPSLHGIASEEQGLTHQSRKRRRLIGLGHEKRWLGSITGQIAFGIGGDEDHWHLERVKQVIDGIEPGTAIRELGVGQNQSRPMASCKRGR
jgi:hypothetical protein